MLYKIFDSKEKGFKLSYFILIICVLFLFFVPTSNDGMRILQVYRYLVAIIISTLILWRNEVNIKNMLLILVLIGILLFFSLTSLFHPQAEFSIVVMFNYISIMLVTTIVLKENTYLRKYEMIFNICNILIIVWGILIILDIEVIKNFTSQYYNQFYDDALYYSMIKNKPVTSFGVHSVASIYYTLMFFLNYFTYKRKNNKKNINLIFCFLYTIITFLLKSNTSIICSVIMFIYMLSIDKNIFYKVIFIFLLISTMFLLLNAELIEYYISAITSKVNGFGARYNSSLFNGNKEFIKQYFALGFNVLQGEHNLHYTDSGVYTYLLRGNFLFVIGFYWMLYNFLTKNLKFVYAITLFCFIIAVEIGYPILLDFRFTFCLLIIVIHFKQLNFMDNY